MKITYWVVFFCLASTFVTAQASPVMITSPDGQVVVQVEANTSGHLEYSVKFHGAEVVAPSLLGLTLDGRNLGENVSLEQATQREIDETYLLLGGHAIAHNQAHETIIAIKNGTDSLAWSLEVRVFNDGAAYRYHVPGHDDIHKLNGEVSSWVVPLASEIWYQNDLGAYEGVYTHTTVGELKPDTTLAFPTTLKLPNGEGYMTLTEANLVHYSDMVVKADTNRALNAYFYADAQGWSTSGEIFSPWRVTILSKDLNGLVNSDIVHNLCPPPSAELAAADWIHPGRSTWQWWNSGGPKLQEQHQWVDWTKQLGFEYYLIDEGWANWKPTDGKTPWDEIKEITAYAKTQGVKIIIWVNTREVLKPLDRKAYFDKARACDVAGLKIDFPPRGSEAIVNWYEDTLRAAADLHFVIDFHGAIKPTGRDRTWPNEINREGIRGHEYQINRYHRTLAPEHDTILPFTRYIAGHADYTPTAFNPDELRGYTWPRELAQAVVFTSPYLCYADHPRFYLTNPALEVMQAIPSTWDETVVLPGSEIGKVVAVARRKGNQWFIAAMNAGEPSHLDIDLQFLGSANFNLVKLEDVPGKDNDLTRTKLTVKSSDHVILDLRAKGGFVGWLTPTNSQKLQ